ncbi:MAG: type II secretion system F family protein [Hydrogenibacillus schlegelii]|uniref:Type II secretion system F family protein n=1 Tax=Hydrogenibacillus schlegelii TaxID=1484 RepID=A0A947CY11_HYDSH|nr:type II secretion system F family protein [Hydrogenibacillus schlegelii]
MLDLILASAVLSLIAALHYALLVYRIRRRNDRLKAWFPETRKKERQSIFRRWGDAYDRSAAGSRLKVRLAQANVGLKPSEYMFILLVLYLVTWFFIARVMRIIPPVDGILAYLLVWLGSRTFLNMRKSARAEAFNGQLPEICRLLASTAKAGYTLPQGFEMVARELKPPAGTEFRTVVQELQLGDPFDAVLERLGSRFDSSELTVFVHTLTIQRKLGGNIAEVLEMMATTLDERRRVNEEIKNATTESRSIAYLLLVMPFLMVVVMGLIIPGFINPLFTVFGVLLALASGFLQLIAFLIIRKLSDIRV